MNAGAGGTGIKSSLSTIWAIARKELRGYFGSAVAVIFLATFLAVTLFTFFWVEKFFARGLADLRPMFDWFPLVLILLVGALSMRLWSEEKHVGTIEVLMTLPVPRWQLVVGKFLAGMLLIALALALTFGLPLTVSHLGDLDKGPVIGGYIAALLLAGAYLAIGMCVSAATDNQIVALVGTALVCGLAYLPGTAAVADLAGSGWGDFLRKIGTGSRFASIARGVLDLRDLAYYIGLIVVFLAVNVMLLGRQTAGKSKRARVRRFAGEATVLLLIGNMILLNVWLSPIARARVDLTQHGAYSLSSTTAKIIDGLDEPLLIRFYSSSKTHPKLAPLVPQIKDMLEEYRIVGDGKVKVEIVDPSGNDEAIKEAKERYSIESTPLRFASRLEKGVINAYFTILVEYGNQHASLGFDDLIEVRQLDVGDVDIQLKNLEYDITRTIKKVVQGFQSVDAMFASLPGKATITEYVTPETLPDDLKGAVDKLDAAVKDLQASSNGKLELTKVAPKSQEEMEDAYRKFGVRPYAIGFGQNDFYYFAIVIQVGDRAARITPPSDQGQDSFKNSLIEGLKRAAPGFTKVVGLWVPKAGPAQPPMMEGMPPQQPEPPQEFNGLREELSGNYEVRDVPLAGEPVPDEVEALVLAGPDNLSPEAVAAIDQYVMRGGALVVLDGHYRISMQPSMTGGASVEPVTTGLEAMLQKWGITVSDEMTLDSESEKFPSQDKRDLGDDTRTNEVQMLPFPFFVKVDGDRLARGNALTAGAPGAIMHFASAVTVDPKLGSEPRKVTTFMSSSSGAWQSQQTSIDPDFAEFPRVGFGKPKDLAADKKGSRVLAAAVIGGLPSAVVEDTTAGAGSGSGAGSSAAAGAGGGSGSAGERKLVHSPPDARVVVFGSSAFASDLMLNIGRQFGSGLAASNLLLVHNAVDWAMADTDLLSIRAGGASSRVLTVDEGSYGTWELFNYILAAVLLGVVIAISWFRRKRVRPIELPRAGVAS